MLFSSTCQHALRALVYLSVHQDRWPILVREIAAAESIPRPFLSKILHDLNKKGLLASSKGPGGGYGLARPPSQIQIREIIEAIDGPLDVDTGCVLGLDECSDDAPCALHDFWKPFRAQYKDAMNGLSLADAALTLSKKRQHDEDVGVEREKN